MPSVQKLAALSMAGALAVAAGALAYESYQIRKLPLGNPTAFLANRDDAAGRRVVVCLGASIVHGRISVDFVDLLRRRVAGRDLVFVNAGVSGDLAYNARQRLDQVVACAPDYVVVLVGTNDVTSTLNENVARLAMRSRRLPCRPSIAWYRENLAQIVVRLQEQTRAAVGLASLPVLGEDLASLANERVRAFNAVIREVAEAHGAAYLPVHERQAAFLARARADHGRPFRGNPLLVMAAGVQRFLLGQDLDSISRRNGLVLTTDLMHMNSQGANLIADEVAAFLA